jgi:hypothetical protein
MAGVFQSGVFQPNVFQLADGEPVLPPITSFGSIETAFAVHTKQPQRKLPRHVQRHLLKQIEAQLKADADTRRLIERMRLQLVATPGGRRLIDSNASLMRRAATL